MSPHQAIRALLVNGKTMFPHHLLKALIDQLSIYPLGTTVRLNTGETGVVFQLNRQYPTASDLASLATGCIRSGAGIEDGGFASRDLRAHCGSGAHRLIRDRKIGDEAVRQLIPRHLIGLLGAGAIIAVAFVGCHNPANSSLPPSAIGPPGAAVPPLPKGDVYADETVPTSETPIETGDTLEVVIRRGAGEEKFSSVVRENGKISVGFMEVDVGGVTAAVAEARVQEAAVPYMRQPRVQVLLKKKVLKVKRVFVFGDVKKPGMVPMHETHDCAASPCRRRSVPGNSLNGRSASDSRRRPRKAAHSDGRSRARVYLWRYDEERRRWRKTISYLCRANIWAMRPRLPKR